MQQHGLCSVGSPGPKAKEETRMTSSFTQRVTHRCCCCSFEKGGGHSSWKLGTHRNTALTYEHLGLGFLCSFSQWYLVSILFRAALYEWESSANSQPSALAAKLKCKCFVTHLPFKMNATCNTFARHTYIPKLTWQESESTIQRSLFSLFVSLDGVVTSNLVTLSLAQKRGSLGKGSKWVKLH